MPLFNCYDRLDYAATKGLCAIQAVNAALFLFKGIPEARQHDYIGASVDLTFVCLLASPFVIEAYITWLAYHTFGDDWWMASPNVRLSRSSAIRSCLSCANALSILWQEL